MEGVAAPNRFISTGGEEGGRGSDLGPEAGELQRGNFQWLRLQGQAAKTGSRRRAATARQKGKRGYNDAICAGAHPAELGVNQEGLCAIRTILKKTARSMKLAVW